MAQRARLPARSAQEFPGCRALRGDDRDLLVGGMIML